MTKPPVVTGEVRARALLRTRRKRIFRPGEVLQRDTVGGTLILAAAVAAVLLANSPWSGAYQALRSYEIGPGLLHLRLPLATWAADGLLAIFFFVAGLELKREFVVGELRDRQRAAVPIVATVGGVVVPAIIYLLVNLLMSGSSRGWAIPTATDIAFALAVLAVIGRNLPPAARAFLLTLAVLDDLIAITIIACFFTMHLAWLPLMLALAPLVVFALLVRRGVRSPWLLLPVAGVTWVLIHASGVHATVVGVLLAFTVPVTAKRGAPAVGLNERFQRRFRPFSAGFVVPAFAFFASGIALGDAGGLLTAFRDPVAIGVVAGLLIGKPAGIMGGTWLISRVGRFRTGRYLSWADLFGLSVLAGIGFTVSLLVGELAYGLGTVRDSHVKVAVFTGSLAAAILAVLILGWRNRVHRLRMVSEDRGDVAVPGNDSLGTTAIDGRRVPVGASPSEAFG